MNSAMPSTTVTSLPAGVTVFERGWLSSNNVLITSGDLAALVDTGYGAHAPQTVALVKRALGGRPLDLLLNTHLHSDHCGGNAALQIAYPTVRTSIPPGQADAVSRWDEEALTYAPTGQQCERFHFDGLLKPGTEIRLGHDSWQVHAAPGHDPHSVMLFEPRSRTLISADALWENGFGVVFPELEGDATFAEVAATLDLIEALDVQYVIPGHGAVFGGRDVVRSSLQRARSRLSGFVQDPRRHAAHAAKVLIKFKLLEWQSVPTTRFMSWAGATRYLGMVQERYFGGEEREAWIQSLVAALVKANAIGQDAAMIYNI
jgi:glyoxylase-like metal-dependent hydrolase (beta-lactamase superfamily II)